MYEPLMSIQTMLPKMLCVFENKHFYFFHFHFFFYSQFNVGGFIHLTECLVFC